MEYVTVFFLLIFFHFLADYPLQGDFLAKAKNRHNPIPGIPWQHAMVAHCGIHSGFVFLATGNLFLAYLEFIAHLLIDKAKCDEVISYNTDQALHIATKILLVVLLMVGV